MEYTAVIRTLGTAGDKYQQLLDSLAIQTIRPKKIIVYIADGYALPKETIGWEEYVYVKKGMVAQRALAYDEVDTEYILFLDDDLKFPADFVSRMYRELTAQKADVISPDIYDHSQIRSLGALMMYVSGRMCGRKDDGKWGYKVMRNAGYSYNKNPRKPSYLSQTNAGACFLCKKEDFLSIHFEEEFWLDAVAYPLGEDQAMYYKMYLHGLKIITWYNCGIVHLDAGDNTNPNKKKSLIYSDFRFKTIFWHRFIYISEKSVAKRAWDILCIVYAFAFTLLISLIKLDFGIFRVKQSAMRDAIRFIESEEYRKIPIIKKNI